MPGAPRCPNFSGMKLLPLDRQVMVITGASSGIGLVTARMAAKRGARVMLVARNAYALAQIVEGIRADGGEAEFAVADVGDRAELAAAAEAAVARFGRIDTWVNNAGVAIYAKLIDTPDDEHRRMFQTNYFGCVHGSTIAVPFLRKQGGALITVASVASDIPSPILGAYAASKHAVKAFVESLRIELIADDAPISVTLIKPSGVATPIAQHAANHLDGEPLIPPPPYDPALVAEAILRAAQHPCRVITVGGAGRAQALLGTHFPAVFARLAPLMIPLLASRSTPKTPDDNLNQAGTGGVERSPDEPGLQHSLYNWIDRHSTAVAATGVMAAAAIVLARRRSDRG